MEAKNLRIGNWLNGSYNGFSKDVQIYDFDRKEIQHSDDKQMSIPISNFKPIKLFDKWFADFNFEKGSNFWINGNLKITILSNGQYIYAIDNWKWVVVEHVHHLQNLFFALTLNELEMKDECSTCG